MGKPCNNIIIKDTTVAPHQLLDDSHKIIHLMPKKMLPVHSFRRCFLSLIFTCVRRIQ